ncbi:MAG: hypothetical protein MUC59_19540, partial [Saprospiraceae bacterium]|nr:hypothetical protein [Saprospiraceae bacterium]
MRFSACLFFCLFASWTIAQVVAPFQLKDEEAININQEVLELLTLQKWACMEQTFVMYNYGKTYPIQFAELSLDKNGNCLHNGMEGKWYVLEDKLLVIELDTSDFNNRNIHFEGGFSIHYADEKEITLVKNLTTDFDNRIVYNLKNEEEIEKSKKAKIAALKESKRYEIITKPAIEPVLVNDKVNIDDLRKYYSKMTLEELRSLLLEEAFFRQVNP